MEDINSNIVEELRRLHKMCEQVLGSYSDWLDIENDTDPRTQIIAALTVADGELYEAYDRACETLGESRG